MPTKARYLFAALSDGLFIASVGVGAVALLLEDSAAVLRALALSDLPPAAADATWSAAAGESLGSVLMGFDDDLFGFDVFEGCGPDCVDEDCDPDHCGPDCCAVAAAEEVVA